MFFKPFRELLIADIREPVRLRGTAWPGPLIRDNAATSWSVQGYIDWQGGMKTL
jgi:hypothetical protein